MGEIGAQEYGRLISSIRLDLLDLFGDEYIAQHVAQTFAHEQEQLVYQNYIADAIYALGHGKALERRFLDVYQQMHGADHPVDERSAEEIKTDIMTKLNKGGGN